MGWREPSWGEDSSCSRNRTPFLWEPNPDVRSRIAELRQEIESSFVRLHVTERDRRLQALQDRWAALRGATAALAREDYAAAMTGVVVRELRWIGGKDGYEITEYEINATLIECLNLVEKRAAIETGKEVDRADIKLRGSVNAEEEMLKRAFTWEELSTMDARMRAAASGQVVEAKAIPAQETHTSGEVEGGVTPSQATKSPESWRD